MIKTTLTCLVLSLVIASPFCTTKSIQVAGADSPAPSDTNTGSSQELAELPAWRFDGFDELPEVPEPSGLCYHPGRDTLFIIDDGDIERSAAVFEIDLQAGVLASRPLGIDLEGICYCSLDGLLYIADEMGETVFVVNPEGLVLLGSFTYLRTYGDRALLVAGGNGVEGIEFIPDADEPEAGYFLLLNQDDPHCVFRINHEDIKLGTNARPAPIRAYWPVKQINLGELHYEHATGELWIIHSWMNVMEAWDIETMELLRWEVFPGSAQEAVTVDGQGRLWVGYDSGGIARYVRAAEREEAGADPVMQREEQ